MTVNCRVKSVREVPHIDLGIKVSHVTSTFLYLGGVVMGGGGGGGGGPTTKKIMPPGKT